MHAGQGQGHGKWARKRITHRWSSGVGISRTGNCVRTSREASFFLRPGGIGGPEYGMDYERLMIE